MLADDQLRELAVDLERIKRRLETLTLGHSDALRLLAQDLQGLSNRIERQRE
jgi:hypothetical protein